MITRSARVPLVVLAVCAAFVVAAVVMIFVGGWTTGVSWDEPFYEGALLTYLNEGWFAVAVLDGQPLGVNTYVYGPVFQLLGHGLTALFGAGTWTDVSVTAQAYSIRHVALGIVAITGIAAAAAIVRLLLSSWRWAVVSAAVLGSIALWTGHAMFNVTDIPVASGYTILTLGLIVIAASGSATRLVRNLVLGAATVVLGIVITVGTRPGTWPAVVISIMIALAGIGAIAWTRDRDKRSTWMGLGSVAIACTVAYLILLAVYPNVFARPFTTLRGAVSQSASFDGGQRETSILDVASYIPTWLYRQLPIVVMALFVLGLACAGWLLVRPFLRSRREALPQDSWRALAVALVSAQLLVMPVASVVLRSNVYDGVRQFLFVIPPIAILATLGVWSVVTLLSGTSKVKVVSRGVVWTVVLAGIGIAFVDQVRLFPYNYVYVNELAASQLDERGLPTDYWRTSMRELIPSIPAEGATHCGFDPLALGLLPDDCATHGQLSPYWDTRGTSTQIQSIPPTDYLFVETNRGRWQPAPELNCLVLDEVTRTLHGRDLTMSYVALCPPP